MKRLAGIEMGGTKTVVVLGRPGAILDRVEFATAGPDETLKRAARIVVDWHANEPVAALGVASFGPIRVNPSADDFGTMLDTPKPGWKGAQVYARLAEWTGLPLALDTDVNGAALAEHRLGAGLGCETLVYYTIGTGIGGGVLVRGSPLHGALHPEIGHVRLRRAPGDTFAGACAFHGDCAEGLLSGPALAARFGRHPATVPPQDPAWAPAARDLAELLAMTVLTFSPQRIVVGGGVTGRQPRLLSAAIGRMPAILGGYLRDCTAATLQDLVVAPHLGDDAGPTGALILAERALAA
ncbi:ROK family protein [Novosphingobium colocasiae]|uniref:fructokinase n=1 Tax=Novosphingobium colocasiae TaxID=1256513 RepID=A0A918PAW3_9SPHN|nr:ROK family protein [Novosphingobium colocasiae]GGY94797.1 fructokinase [Novosphingobium colocasiae]